MLLVEFLYVDKNKQEVVSFRMPGLCCSEASYSKSETQFEEDRNFRRTFVEIRNHSANCRRAVEVSLCHCSSQPGIRFCNKNRS